MPKSYFRWLRTINDFLWLTRHEQATVGMRDQNDISSRISLVEYPAYQSPRKTSIRVWDGETTVWGRGIPPHVLNLVTLLAVEVYNVFQF